MTSKFDPAAMYRPSVDGEPDWQRDETTLFEASLAALTKFKIDHPNEMVSAFGFDSEPCYGYALIGIETPMNALEVATRREEYEIQNRYEQFARDEAWRSARYYTSREALDYSNSTGYFAYAAWAQVDFPGWGEFAAGENYPEKEQPEDPDYLEGHACLIFWRVIERLIEGGAFAGLNLWSPFRLGFNFHDERFITLRMLNRQSASSG